MCNVELSSDQIQRILKGESVLHCLMNCLIIRIYRLSKSQKYYGFKKFKLIFDLLVSIVSMFSIKNILGKLNLKVTFPCRENDACTSSNVFYFPQLHVSHKLYKILFY